MSQNTEPLDPDVHTEPQEGSDTAQPQAGQDTAEPTAEPGEDFPGQGLVGHVVTWEGDDGSGNSRRQFGVVLGEHEIQEGKLDVALLRGSLERAYDPDDLSVLGS